MAHCKAIEFDQDQHAHADTTSFLTIGPLGPTILEGFTLNGLGGLLGHVTHKAAKKLSFPYIWGLRTKFGFNWLSGLEYEDV